MKQNEYNIDELLGVYIIKDNSGNYRLIISTFIYDVKNYYHKIYCRCSIYER